MLEKTNVSMKKSPSNEPFVDVILPNYNKAEFLEDAIKSVINQTYKSWYLYVVDDCSKDDSGKILANFSNFKNIKIVKLNKNKGPSFCRNYAMRISRSKYIAFIDSDDSWLDDKLEKQIFFMEKNNYTFTYSDYSSFFKFLFSIIFKKRSIIGIRET